jgi:hypothetical protein
LDPSTFAACIVEGSGDARLRQADHEDDSSETQPTSFRRIAAATRGVTKLDTSPP